MAKSRIDKGTSHFAKSEAKRKEKFNRKEIVHLMWTNPRSKG